MCCGMSFYTIPIVYCSYISSDLWRDFLGMAFSARGLGAKAPGKSKGYNCNL